MMNLSSAATAEELELARAVSGSYAQSVYAENTQPEASAVSWGAILAGAAAAAALSLILLILGTGLGLSSVSPWAHDGVNATMLGVSTIVWLSVTQLLASGMGGYLAGRLRTKWVGTHTDEVYFRDTAHGFLAWAVASIATAALLTSVITSIIGSSVQAGTAAADGLATTAATAGAALASNRMPQAGNQADHQAGNDGGSMNYFVDSLFRKDATAPVSTSTSASTVGNPVAEITGIFMNTINTGVLSAEDLHYLGQLVAQRTGLSQQDAEQRVSATYERAQAKLRDAQTAARSAADQARKASAHTALWLFVSLLIGAFVASLMATFGGRQRDA